jgi:hypothetical protein
MFLPAELLNGLYTQLPLTRELTNTIVATKQAVHRDETKIDKFRPFKDEAQTALFKDPGRTAL